MNDARHQHEEDLAVHQLLAHLRAEAEATAPHSRVSDDNSCRSARSLLFSSGCDITADQREHRRSA